MQSGSIFRLGYTFTHPPTGSLKPTSLFFPNFVGRRLLMET